MRRLRSGAEGEFERALAKALFAESAATRGIPQQTLALAKIWWPLVVSTNYDNFFAAAFAAAFGPHGVAVVGRNPQDCQRVLTSLSTAGRSLLWALQGHLGQPCPPPDGHEADGQRLYRDIVLDHAEYRRVTHREPHFRRAFAEVFRQRSLVFLGTGIAEPYFQELFGEVLEFYGPSPRPHFALLPEGEVDPAFMYSRLQIAVVEFPRGAFDRVPQCLGELARQLDARVSVPVSWSWGAAPIAAGPAILAHTPRLTISSDALPTRPIAGECLAVSAGGMLAAPEFFLSAGGIQDTARGWGVPESQLRHPEIEDGTGYVGKYPGRDVFAVRARRARDDKKDLASVGPASTALFEAAAARYPRIHMQLLASGGGDDDADQPSWSARPFPPRFSFIETVRAGARGSAGTRTTPAASRCTSSTPRSPGRSPPAGSTSSSSCCATTSASGRRSSSATAPSTGGCSRNRHRRPQRRSSTSSGSHRPPGSSR